MDYRHVVKKFHVVKAENLPLYLILNLVNPFHIFRPIYAVKDKVFPQQTLGDQEG
jgi:hypothetical protein